MKTVISITMVLVLCLSSAQAGSRLKQRLGVGARYNTQKEEGREVTFDDDTTYGLIYELHEGGTFWQLGAQYGTSYGTNNVDYIVTPEINLMLADGAWRGGVGALATYISSDEGSDWSDIYYQFLLGLDFPMGGLAVGVQAAYTFEDFDSLGKFDFDALDWTGYVSYIF